MTSTYNIIGSWLTLFVSGLESYDIDGPAFLADYGFNYPEDSNPDKRVSISTMAVMWDKAAELTGDEEFGLKAGTFITPTTFSALGMALWSSCSVRDMLQCWCRYLHMFSTAAEMTIVEEAGKLTVLTHQYPDEDGNSPASIYALDATLSALHSMGRSHYSLNLAPLAVELSRPRPKNPEHYEDFFGCPVSFDNPTIKLVYDLEEISRPIPGGNPQLAQATEKLVVEYLGRMQLQPANTQSLLPQVRQALFELLPRGEANLDDVAAQLHVSPRTLHRKLDEQGTNFRQLLEEVRKQLALDYIGQPHLSIGEISFLLGFASNSNFSRAFKRWTGQSPQGYRQQPR